MRTGFVRVNEKGETKSIETYRKCSDEIVVTFEMKSTSGSNHTREEAFCLTDKQAIALRKLLKKALKDDGNDR